MQKELESINTVLTGLEKECLEAERKIGGIKSDLEAKRRAKNNMASEAQKLQLDIGQEENRRAAIRSKIELLEDVVKKHEGFYQGVKNILFKMDEPGSSFKGIIGVAADMIKVEKGYEEAVNTFLGDNAQLLVTEKDSDISQAIEYLKNNKLGKATFVSLETLRRLKAMALLLKSSHAML